MHPLLLTSKLKILQQSEWIAEVSVRALKVHYNYKRCKETDIVVAYLTPVAQALLKLVSAVMSDCDTLTYLRGVMAEWLARLLVIHK